PHIECLGHETRIVAFQPQANVTLANERVLTAHGFQRSAHERATPSILGRAREPASDNESRRPRGSSCAFHSVRARAPHGRHASALDVNLPASKGTEGRMAMAFEPPTPVRVSGSSSYHYY